jgi:hypothetical protein
MATESEVFAMEGFSVLVQVASGLMQGHSRLEFEVSRVLNLAQNVPCFLVKAEKMVCCPMKSFFIAARCRFYQNNHLKGPCSVPWGVLWHSFDPPSDLPLKGRSEILDVSLPGEQHSGACKAQPAAFFGRHQ